MGLVFGYAKLLGSGSNAALITSTTFINCRNLRRFINRHIVIFLVPLLFLLFLGLLILSQLYPLGDMLSSFGSS